MSEHQRKPAAPKGWKLVPVEPTVEMLDQWIPDPDADPPMTLCKYSVDALREIYQALLAAAPAAPSAAAQDERAAFGKFWRDHCGIDPDDDMEVEEIAFAAFGAGIAFARAAQAASTSADGRETGTVARLTYEQIKWVTDAAAILSNSVSATERRVASELKELLREAGSGQ